MLTTILHAYSGMRQKMLFSIFTLFCISPFVAMAQIPDTLLAVRTSALETRLGLHVNGAFYLGGTFNPNIGAPLPPIEGPGTRLFWYPEKSAFRAGTIDGTQWDDANIGTHSLAIGENTRASADNAVALGRYCTAAQINSFAIGDQNTASGAASVAMGYHAHTNARQGSFVFGDRSTIDTIRAGVNHSASWRVSGGFRIFTSSNLSTGVTIQSGTNVSNWGQSNAVISTYTGAMLSTGGVWQNSSDVNRKHHFENISGETILQQLRSIPIQKWSYKSEDENIRHIGPTAQDFYAAFQLGSDEKGIGTVDADGIALAAVQALDTRTQDQTASIKALQKENEHLRSRLDAMENKAASNNASLPQITILIIAGMALGALLLKYRSRKSA
ncbi:tail fiber domain-containing protein [Pseudobacter ginsenosidimutans]|uniref:Endosialidase-like protein n=1 Tax=Pseudobacter ginsenosidimutans TaxID=661488 RepID=A0A4Q7N159_9BACT|nr:tail fiber domain-containing protein [Pseudobacter ginsenosidimutans]QEC43672.1 hypothetical protein FSB84_19025 [Pseudobacter ginsenosidimutans]RZS75073.1 endosialidase-like protein [Pseudobacter ginsenosidimutans]